METSEVIAIVGGHVNQELLLRNEYLAAENEILKSKFDCPVPLKNEDRIRLAVIGRKIGMNALRDVACIVKPETSMMWFRKLVAKKFDGSQSRVYPGRPAIDPEIESLVLRFAGENPGWGYDQIVGVLGNLGYDICDQTVGNILKKNGVSPSPTRKVHSTWSDFIESHKHVMAACDFFTTEAITPAGLITYYVLFFIHIGSRKIHIAGVTDHPDEIWMKQMARNVTMAAIGFLSNCRYLIQDRDSKFSDSFRSILESCGVKPIRLPPRSPNLNAYAERFVRSIKEECLSNLILLGEHSLMNALKEYTDHYHEERNHQGKNNGLLVPSESFDPNNKTGTILCKERLGGLLKYYYRNPTQYQLTG